MNVKRVMRPYDDGTKCTYKLKFEENIKFLNDPTEVYEKVARPAMRQRIDKTDSEVDRAIIGFQPQNFFYKDGESLLTEVYYQAKTEQRGVLALKYDHMSYQSVKKDISF